MSVIDWKRVVFWAALWWFVYTAPTESPFAAFRGDGESVAEYDAAFE